MILNGQNALLREKIVLRSPQKNLYEDRPIISAAKCRSITRVSGNITYAYIRGGFSGKSRQTIVRLLKFVVFEHEFRVRVVLRIYRQTLLRTVSHSEPSPTHCLLYFPADIQGNSACDNRAVNWAWLLNVSGHSYIGCIARSSLRQHSFLVVILLDIS